MGSEEGVRIRRTGAALPRAHAVRPPDQPGHSRRITARSAAPVIDTNGAAERGPGGVIPQGRRREGFSLRRQRHQRPPGRVKPTAARREQPAEPCDGGAALASACAADPGRAHEPATSIVQAFRRGDQPVHVVRSGHPNQPASTKLAEFSRWPGCSAASNVDHMLVNMCLRNRIDAEQLGGLDRPGPFASSRSAESLPVLMARRIVDRFLPTATAACASE